MDDPLASSAFESRSVPWQPGGSGSGGGGNGGRSPECRGQERAREREGERGENVDWEEDVTPKSRELRAAKCQQLCRYNYSLLSK